MTFSCSTKGCALQPSALSAITSHCLAKVMESIDKFLSSAMLASCTIADATKFQDNALPLETAISGFLLVAVCEDLSNLVEKFCRFDDPLCPDIPRMPHVEDARNAATIITQVMHSP